MAINIDDVYYATAKGRNLGENWLNRFWYTVTGNDDSVTPADLIVGFLLDVIYDKLKDRFHDGWFLDEIKAYLWRNPGENSALDTSGLAGAEILAQPAPSNLSVSYITPNDIAGQPTGRKGFGGLSEADIDGNLLALRQEFIDVGVALGSNITDGGMEITPCLVFTASIPEVGLGVNPVVSRYARGTWQHKLGSQNSRKPGYGT